MRQSSAPGNQECCQLRVGTDRDTASEPASKALPVPEEEALCLVRSLLLVPPSPGALGTQCWHTGGSTEVASRPALESKRTMLSAGAEPRSGHGDPSMSDLLLSAGRLRARNADTCREDLPSFPGNIGVSTDVLGGLPKSASLSSQPVNKRCKACVEHPSLFCHPSLQ